MSERDVSRENDGDAKMKLLRSIPPLHQRQTKQNHLNSSFVPLSPADLETAVAAAMIDFKEITRHFPLSKIIHYAPNESARLYLSPRRRETEREIAGEKIQIYYNMLERQRKCMREAVGCKNQIKISSEWHNR